MGFLEDATIWPKGSVPKAQRVLLAVYFIRGGKLKLRWRTVTDMFTIGVLEIVPPDGRLRLTEKGVRMCAREIAAEKAAGP